MYHGYKFKMAQLLWKRVWQFLRHLNMVLAYDPAIHPVFLCERMEAGPQRYINMFMFKATLFETTER